MTKKDYIKAAKIVNEKRIDAKRSGISPTQQLYEENVSVELAEAFVQLFQGDNPRFNRERFLSACGVLES